MPVSRLVTVEAVMVRAAPPVVIFVRLPKASYSYAWVVATVHPRTQPSSRNHAFTYWHCCTFRYANSRLHHPRILSTRADVAPQDHLFPLLQASPGAPVVPGQILTIDALTLVPSSPTLLSVRKEVSNHDYGKLHRANRVCQHSVPCQGNVRRNFLALSENPREELMREMLKLATILASLGLAPVAPSVAQIQSSWASVPPQIDGSVGTSEWAGAGIMTTPHGKVSFTNRSAYLYVLIDVTGDTTEDPLLPGPYNDDFFGLFFDINGNGSGDPGIDLDYSLIDSPPQIPVISYLAVPDCGWTGGLQTTSLGAHGFGPSPSSATPHTIWELALRLSELRASPGDLVRLSTIEFSPNPSIFDEAPAGLCDWQGYQAVRLAALPPIAPGDVNGDGATTVQDVFYLINYLFAGGPAPV